MNLSSLSILLAEDDETDVFLLQRAFRQAQVLNPLHIVPDGFEAIERLSRSKSRPEDQTPGLVILDLKMPRQNGLEVLQWMREQPVIRSIPVLILSSSVNQRDFEAAYELGANGFLTKPPSLEERKELAQFIKDWLRLIQAPLAATDSFRAALAHRIVPGVVEN